MSSVGAFAGMGGLNVQSNLGEPFSGSITITGSEAQALLQGGKLDVSGGDIRGTVIPQSNGSVIVRLSSSSNIYDPIINFSVTAGAQTRQYSAMINPMGYRQPAPVVQQYSTVNKQKIQSVETKTKTEMPEAVKPAAHAQYHKVKPGETLYSIAKHYRPHNMSVQRAVSALVAANPNAFRNGDPAQMYQNATLYIPSASQWQSYAEAKRKPSVAKRTPKVVIPKEQIKSQQDAVVEKKADRPNKPDETKDKVVVKAKPEVKPAPVETKPASEPEIASMKPAPEPKPVLPPVVGKPVESPVAELPKPDEKVEAKQPEMPKVEKPAEEPVVSTASEPKSETVGEINTASEPIAEIASDVNDVVSSEANIPVPEVPEPVVPKVEATVAPQPVEEDVDWLKMGALGAAGLAALGGGAYLLSRRRRKDEDEDDGYDDSEIEDDEIPSSAVGSGWNAPWNQQEDTVFDDTSDFIPEYGHVEDEFAVHAEPVQTDSIAPETVVESEFDTAVSKKSSFDLKSFEPDLPPVANTAAADSEDWDWLAEDVISTSGSSSDASTVVESETFDLADFSDDALALNENEQQQIWDDFATISQTVSKEDAQYSEKQQIAEQRPAQVLEDVHAVETVQQVDSVIEMMEGDLEEVGEFMEFQSTEQAEPVSSGEIHDEILLDDIVEFDTDNIVDDEPVSVQVAEEVRDTAQTVFEPDEDDMLSFDLSDLTDDTETGEEVVTSVQVAENVEEDLLVFETDESSHDKDFEVPSVTSSASELLDISVEDDILADVSVSDNVVPDNPVLDSISVSYAPKPVDDALLDLAESHHFMEGEDVGFVSEAVGMTEPLEAKLELAKMYLEIDDAVAARETLRELIEESSGSVQRQAKELLDELGG